MVWFGMDKDNCVFNWTWNEFWYDQVKLITFSPLFGSWLFEWSFSDGYFSNIQEGFDNKICQALKKSIPVFTAIRLMFDGGPKFVFQETSWWDYTKSEFKWMDTQSLYHKPVCLQTRQDNSCDIFEHKRMLDSQVAGWGVISTKLKKSIVQMFQNLET